MAKRAASPRAGMPATKQKAKKPTARQMRRRSVVSSVYKVFISHSSKEKWVALQISKEIKAIGVETWVDDADLLGGDEIKSNIKRGIQECQEVVVVMSMNSAMSQWVVYEAALAEIKKRRITPILNNVGPDVIAPLQGIKGYDLNDFDKFLLELARRAAQSRKDRK